MDSPRLRIPLAAAGALFLAACAGDGEPPPQPDPKPPQPDHLEDRAARDAPRIEDAQCPPEVAGCVSATGTILYVERVDPDGDGDAHFVILDSPGVTAPGVTVIDVPPELRPQPLPGPGEAISAAGPVGRGSYDQRQIGALDVNVAAR